MSSGYREHIVILLLTFSGRILAASKVIWFGDLLTAGVMLVSKVRKKTAF
jgi:hypothetical protein